MTKASVIFNFQGVDIRIQCSKEEKMKDICQKLATKIERNVNSLVFLYGGSNLNFQLSFKDQANIIDKERNEMKVLVYKNESDELSCPKCGEKINLNTEKINDIKSSIKNIDDTIRGAKLMIENILRISTMDVVNIQLKTKFFSSSLCNISLDFKFSYNCSSDISLIIKFFICLFNSFKVWHKEAIILF